MLSKGAKKYKVTNGFFSEYFLFFFSEKKSHDYHQLFWILLKNEQPKLPKFEIWLLTED